MYFPPVPGFESGGSHVSSPSGRGMERWWANCQGWGYVGVLVEVIIQVIVEEITQVTVGMIVQVRGGGDR